MFFHCCANSPHLETDNPDAHGSCRLPGTRHLRLRRETSGLDQPQSAVRLGPAGPCGHTTDAGRVRPRPGRSRRALWHPLQFACVDRSRLCDQIRRAKRQHAGRACPTRRPAWMIASRSSCRIRVHTEPGAAEHFAGDTPGPADTLPSRRTGSDRLPGRWKIASRASAQRTARRGRAGCPSRSEVAIAEEVDAASTARRCAGRVGHAEPSPYEMRGVQHARHAPSRARK